MTPLESFNNLPETPVQKSTGVSETSKEYQNPLSRVNEINQKKEKIDKYVSEIGLSKEEIEKIIDIIISKFGNNDKKIDFILDEINSKATDYNSILQIITAKETKETAKEVEETAKEVEETAKEAKKIAKEYVGITLKGLNGKNSSYYSDIIKLSENGKIDQVLELLKGKDNKSFNAIAIDLKTESPEKYNQFKTSLITIDPSFEKSFQNFENKEVSTKLELGTSDLSGVIFTKNGVTKDIENNLQVKIENGKRSISTTGINPYFLESEVDTKTSKDEIDYINNELKRSIDTIDKKITIMEFLIKNIETNDKLKEVKDKMRFSDISLYMELNMDSITDITQLKSVIVRKKIELEEEKKVLEKNTKDKIDYIIIEQEIAAEKKDKKTKEILSFLHSIGFDLIDQHITDLFINQINGKLNYYGFSGIIKLDEAKLGFDNDNDLKTTTNDDKKNFLNFFNKIAFGENKNLYISEDITKGIGNITMEQKQNILEITNINKINENFEKSKKIN